MNEVSLINGHIEEKPVMQYTVEKVDNKTSTVRHYINGKEDSWKVIDNDDLFVYRTALEDMGYRRAYDVEKCKKIYENAEIEYKTALMYPLYSRDNISSDGE